MTNVKRIMVVFGVALLAACAGLQRGDNAPAWAAHVSYDGRYLDILELREWPDSQTGTKLMLQVESKAMTTVRISFRVLWYQADGQPVNTVLGKWQERTIESGQTVEIVQSAPGPEAVDYRIEIAEK
ncbi:YcfL family protein [Zhongshania guokunii]|uniref:YcfL family protein n=1 Tax=Zhongshania guokunii TaxID=641783 RepID=A0ABV3U9S1_9GAMM